MRKPRLSNIPLSLALVIIFVFGLPPAVLFSVIGYRALVKDIQEVEARYIIERKAKLSRELDAALDLIDYQRREAHTFLRRGVQGMVDSIHGVVLRTLADQRGRLSEEEIQELVRLLVGGVRFFDGRGYFFAFSLDGAEQLHARAPVREGTTRIAATGAETIDIVERMIALASSGGGFLHYRWPLPDGVSPKEKIAYVRLLEPLGWVIGAGDYPRAFEDAIQAEMILSVKKMKTDSDIAGFIIDRKGELIAGGHANGDSKAGGDGNRQLLRAFGSGSRYAEAPAADGFRRYSISKPGRREPVPVIAIGRPYPPWGWTVGLAVELEGLQDATAEQQARLQKGLMEELSALGAVLVLATAFTLLIGGGYARRVKKNLEAFADFFRKAQDAHEQIDLDRLPFEELDTLGRCANRMVTMREMHIETIRSVNEKLRQANRRLEQMASVDGLTGVANRRFFDEALVREWTRAARSRRPLTVAMIDIDKFKAYNDRYGHQGGDECLQRVAGALRSAVKRPADLVARYGGEEFVVLLSETDLNGGREVAVRMQTAVADLEMEHPEAPAGRVSFSMGLACLVPEPDGDPGTLITLADRALYRAKAEGRNRIETA